MNIYIQLMHHTPWGVLPRRNVPEPKIIRESTRSRDWRSPADLGLEILRGRGAGDPPWGWD